MLSRLNGFSLVELLITMTLSIALLAGVIGFTTQLLTSQRILSAGIVLKTELSLIEEILANELRRAGFNEHAAEQFFARTPSPFTPPISLFATEGQPQANCILFHYDRNRNGTLDIDAPDERYGFKLHKNAIEVRRNGATCDQGGWHDLTDPKTVSINTFALTEYLSANGQRYLRISIEAHHKKFSQLISAKTFYVAIENG